MPAPRKTTKGDEREDSPIVESPAGLRIIPPDGSDIYVVPMPDDDDTELAS